MQVHDPKPSDPRSPDAPAGFPHSSRAPARRSTSTPIAGGERSRPISRRIRHLYRWQKTKYWKNWRASDRQSCFLKLHCQEGTSSYQRPASCRLYYPSVLIIDLLSHHCRSSPGSCQQTDRATFSTFIHELIPGTADGPPGHGIEFLKTSNNASLRRCIFPGTTKFNIK